MDSTAIRISVMGGKGGGISFLAAKDVKIWDKVEGKTKWTRLVERELYSAVFYKRKKTEYEFLAKVEYVYFRDGLLKEIKSFDKKGRLKFQEKFTYVFY